MGCRDVDVFLIPKLSEKYVIFIQTNTHEPEKVQKQIANCPQKYTLILKELVWHSVGAAPHKNLRI